MGTTIEVRTVLGSFQCTAGICDSCMYCGGYITWETDRKGKPVEMTQHLRSLLMLCHPDRHVKTVNEKLATSLTRWLFAAERALSMAVKSKQEKVATT